MKVIVNNNTIFFPHTMAKVTEKDSKGKEINKCITMKGEGLSFKIICKSIQDKENLWLTIMNSEASLDLRKYNHRIEGVQLE